MWLWASGILVLFLCASPTLSKDGSDGVIKEAILSLARIIRDNSQKVERNGAREHRLNENLRKAMEDLTKKVSGVDTYVTHFTRIEDRISEIEQRISQRDERERIQMQKTADSIGNLENRLEAWLNEIRNTISAASQHVEPTQPTKTESVSASDIISRLNDTEAHLLKKVSEVESSLQAIAARNKEETAAQTEKRNKEERLQDQKTEKLIENLEKRLKTQLDGIKSSVEVIAETTPPPPITECASASDIISMLNNTEAHFLKKVERIESSLGTMAIKNANETASQAEKLQTLINERAANEYIQNQKTEELIENAESRLKTRLDMIQSTVEFIFAATPPTPTIECASASDIASALNGTEVHLLEKVAQIESSLDSMATKNANEVVTQAEKLQTILGERDLKERTESQKTEKLMKNLELRLETGLDEIKTAIEVIVEATPSTPTPECASASDIETILNHTEAHLLDKVSRIETTLDIMAAEDDSKAVKEMEKLQTVLNEVQSMNGKLGDIESSLEEVQEAAKKEAEKPKKPVVDIGAIFEEQTRALGNVTGYIENILNRIQDIPTTSEIQALHNETQASLQEAKHTLQSAVSDKINGMIIGVDANNKEIKHSIENVRSDIANTTERINKELRNLINGQALTAQEVLDTKRAVEYGVLQILSQLHESIKDHGAALNETFYRKLDGVSNDIIENHKKAITNLTIKMEEELKQVWRQMTVMYQQMTENAAALSKLNQQNEAYVNGTTSTMDGMETKVGDITKRMTEVDGNLNYLLGRLSLITQEFNQIKTGLGAALDDIKSSFKEVEEKANGLSHPGRHRIPNDYRGDEDIYNINTTPNNLIGAA